MSTYSVPITDGKHVKKGEVENGVSGEAFAAGDFIYLNTDNKWYQADATISLLGKETGVASSKSDGADNTFQFTKERGAIVDMGVTVAKDDHVFPNASGVMANDVAADLVGGNKIHFWGHGDGTDLVFSPQITDYTV